MKHSAMIDSGQRCLDLVQMLMVDEKINKTVAANIAREVQDVMVKGRLSLPYATYLAPCHPILIALALAPIIELPSSPLH
jgi:hypothetical protein